MRCNAEWGEERADVMADGQQEIRRGFAVSSTTKEIPWFERVRVLPSLIGSAAGRRAVGREECLDAIRWRWLGRWVWFGTGIASYGYGLLVGGGPAGWLLAWELEKFRIVEPGFTHLFLVIVLVVPPAVSLLRFADRHRGRSPTSQEVEWRMKRNGRWMIAAGVGLWLAAGAALLYTTTLPDLSNPPIQIAIDQVAPGSAVRQSNAVLTGVPQRKFELSYGYSLRSSRWQSNTSTQRIIPMTQQGWTPAQPVRFLVDTGGVYPDKLSSVDSVPITEPKLAKTDAGLLLRSVPPYLRSAFARRGVVLADDVMLHSADPDAASMYYDVFAGLAGFGGFMLLAFGVVFLIKPGLDRRRGVWPR